MTSETNQSVSLQRQVSERLTKSLVDAGNVKHHVNLTHGFKLINGVKEFWNSKEFSDVVIKTDYGEIKAHKIILASFSSFFKAMFGPHMKESGQSTIEMNGMDHVSLESILGFIYTGEIELSGQTVADLLAVSNFLGIESLVKACVEFLVEHLKPDNSLDVLLLADSQGIKELFDAVKQYVLLKFTDSVKNDMFLQFPIALVSELLKDDLVCVVKCGFVPPSHDQELLIWDTVMRYINHNLKERKEHLPSLLECVRLSFLKPTFLQDMISTNNLIKNSPEAVKKLTSILTKNESQDGNEDEEINNSSPRKIGEHRYLKLRPLADGGQVGPEQGTFDDKSLVEADRAHVKAMKIWIRQWDGRPVLGGMKITYTNGHEMTHGGTTSEDIHEFILDDDEVIIKMNAHAGWMIDTLTFFTNKGRTLGPYGGDGGGNRDCSTKGDFPYLAYFRGTVVFNQESLGITRLSGCFGNYKRQKPCALLRKHKDFEDYSSDDEHDQLNRLSDLRLDFEDDYDYDYDPDEDYDDQDDYDPDDYDPDDYDYGDADLYDDIPPEFYE